MNRGEHLTSEGLTKIVSTVPGPNARHGPVRTAVMTGRTATVRSGLQISGTAAVQSIQLKDHQRPW